MEGEPGEKKVLTKCSTKKMRTNFGFQILISLTPSLFVTHTDFSILCPQSTELCANGQAGTDTKTKPDTNESWTQMNPSAPIRTGMGSILSTYLVLDLPHLMQSCVQSCELPAEGKPKKIRLTPSGAQESTYKENL